MAGARLSPHLGEATRGQGHAELSCAGLLRRKTLFYSILYWQVRVGHDGRRLSLGRFETRVLAEAYRAASQQEHAGNAAACYAARKEAMPRCRGVTAQPPQAPTDVTAIDVAYVVGRTRPLMGSTRDIRGLVGATVRVPDRAWPGYEATRTVCVCAVLAHASGSDEYVVEAEGAHYAFGYALLARYDKTVGKRTAPATPATTAAVGKRTAPATPATTAAVGKRTAPATPATTAVGDRRVAPRLSS